MFETKTVFVLGAGASAEFGFPLGGKLAAEIRALIGPHPRAPESPVGPLVSVLPRTPTLHQEVYYTAARLMYEALAFGNSIDDFLHSRREDEATIILGKLAIAKLILEYEQKSPLIQLVTGQERLGRLGLGNTWLFQLAKLMFKTLTPAQANAAFKNTTFITFNYDRSLELFFMHAVSESFSTSLSDAAAIVRTAPIYHAYGSVGAFVTANRDLNVGYGDALAWRSYTKVAEKIRTYTEANEDRETESAIFQAMTTADRIVFLGCGYHQQNIALLKPDAKKIPPRTIGTTKGISPVGVLEVKNRLGKMYDPALRSTAEDRTNLYDTTCAGLIEEYQMVLTS